MVSSVDRNHRAAPGALESVRDVLNTWRIPNDTRRPVDDFDAHARRARLGRQEAAELRRLRDDLRAVLERRLDIDAAIGRWIDRLAAGVSIHDGSVRFVAADRAAGRCLVTVLDAVVAHSWSRLKACPDCRWVFFDHTRNGRKRWCLMNAGGPNGRGCGNIAKLRRYRARQRATAT